MRAGGVVAHRRAWWIAIRPHTLPAGAAPVVVGTGVAHAEGVLAWGPATAALIGAVLIQIGTNLANDYFDAHRGVDTDDRAGFTRVTHGGLLRPVAVKRAMALSFASAIVIGGYLVWVGGVPIVAIGLISVACGIAYAGGPFPFGSYGLGDLFVFVFFGIVAVTGTYYVQAASVVSRPFPLWPPSQLAWETAVLASIPMACLATAILVVNNLRDIATDRAAGKYTVAVLVGPRVTKAEYAVLVISAYVIPILMLARGAGWWILLPWMTLPGAAVLVARLVRREPDRRLNRTLTRTGQLLIAYATLFTLGVVLA